jgi:hypothetical protein
MVNHYGKIADKGQFLAHKPILNVKDISASIDYSNGLDFTKVFSWKDGSGFYDYGKLTFAKFKRGNVNIMMSTSPAVTTNPRHSFSKAVAVAIAVSLLLTSATIIPYSGVWAQQDKAEAENQRHRDPISFRPKGSQTIRFLR